ncbi:MAG TPA: sulfatase-like hydrolase/transferase, partial [Gemmataceae bacterium]|nr:sulfatase-like hydrolase/transferase [Gemmataceae bacterium]
MRVPYLAALCLAAAPLAAWADAAPRPNVLWICADDHAPYVCGAYGNKQVRTPNLDKLAASGVRFDRAYCNSPVCTASRQSFLTGRYPRSLGVTLLKTALPAGTPTLATMLRAAGYDTAAFGKMHFNSNLPHGFDLRLDLPEHRKHLAAKKRQPLPEGVAVQPPWRPFQDPAAVWLNADCRPTGLPVESMQSTFFVDRALEYLGRHGHGDRPFALIVSFYDPHSPFHFPDGWDRRFRPEEFPVPPVPERDRQEQP